MRSASREGEEARKGQDEIRTGLLLVSSLLRASAPSRETLEQLPRIPTDFLDAHTWFWAPDDHEQDPAPTAVNMLAIPVPPFARRWAYAKRRGILLSFKRFSRNRRGGEWPQKNAKDRKRAGKKPGP